MERMLLTAHNENKNASTRHMHCITTAIAVNEINFSMPQRFETKHQREEIVVGFGAPIRHYC